MGAAASSFDQSAAAPKTRPRLLYLVTEDWYFVLHRLPMARAAQRAGYEIHVATRIDQHGEAIAAEGFVTHPVAWRRGAVNPAGQFTTVRQIRALYRALRPDLVHHVSLQPIILGSIAALGLPMAQVNGLTGLGYVFTADTAKARLIRAVLRPVIPWLLNRTRTVVLVENADDKAALIGFGVDAERFVVVSGSGVDIDRFVPIEEPQGPVTVAFAGRMVDHKGVRTLVDAHELLTQRGLGIRLLLAGDTDAANPAAIPRADLERWAKRPGVYWLGHVNDIRTVWSQAHIAVLASSGGEGVPLSLGEAAACGRPLVASDVSGCREIARPEFNALLVEPDDPPALANAIEQLAADPALRRRYGAAGRKLAVEHFSSERIGSEVVDVYNRLMGGTGTEQPSPSSDARRSLSPQQ